ncbi:hypothetical protein MARINON1_60076 [Marinobacter salarius]|nr:hypothetical protein MARINON1_60076 [Marinobacter salarius]
MDDSCPAPYLETTTRPCFGAFEPSNLYLCRPVRLLYKRLIQIIFQLQSLLFHLVQLIVSDRGIPAFQAFDFLVQLCVLPKMVLERRVVLSQFVDQFAKLGEFVMKFVVGNAHYLVSFFSQSG